MAKITETIGCFVETPCCTECNWFSLPLLVPVNGFMVPPRTVCPECGGRVVEMIGKYKIRETKGFFSGTHREYIDFIRKPVELAVPVPPPPADLGICDYN
jgi:hypothetical protein